MNLDPGAFSEKKRRLLERLLKEKGVQRDPDASITPRADREKARQSFLQEGLWFLDRLDPGKATYNIPCAARLRGKLDTEALAHTFGALLERHEILRTRFPEIGGVPHQVVDPPRGFELPTRDLSGMPASEREAEALRIATEEARNPFDLTRGPVFRALLLKLGELEHVLVISIHHIVSDGWSMGVFTRDLIGLYEAFVQDPSRTAPLKPLAIQFADYAEWQRRWLTGARYERLFSFWKSRLDGCEQLVLPIDRPRSAGSSGAGAHHTFRITPELTERWRAFSKDAGATPFVALLAAFEVLLHTYSGQEDMVIGSPVANRNKSELEPLIGYFVNVLPFRTDLSGNPTFRELIERVRESVDSVHAHQEMPFSKLVEDLKPPRSPGANPIYQVEFTLLAPEHAPPVFGYGFRSPVQETHRMAGVTLHPMEVESGVSKFDLVVLLWDAPVGICGTFEYNPDLFDAATIEALAARFDTLVQRLIAAPDSRLATWRAEFASQNPTQRRPAKRFQPVRRKLITPEKGS